MKVGITGSRTDRPESTLRRVHDLLVDWRVTELHHGDCTGFDAQCHAVAKKLGIKTVAHPPTNPTYRAWCDADEIRPEKPYLDRNRDIVDATEKVIAGPDGPEKMRSGTWSTVRYAKKSGKHGIILTHSADPSPNIPAPQP